MRLKDGEVVRHRLGGRARRHPVSDAISRPGVASNGCAC
jgi:hypothetical protein